MSTYYREARELLRNLLSHADARTAVVILYRHTGGNKRISRASLAQIAEGVKHANARARGDVDRKPFTTRSPLWGAE